MLLLTIIIIRFIQRINSKNLVFFYKEIIYIIVFFNKMTQPILSLCLPTNGISEWVFPVLESVYSQGVKEDLFEVVVTDNGSNSDFAKQMEEYAQKHPTLIYKKTTAFMFLNQIEALKTASGEYLKFLNHRALLEPGALQWMIDFIVRYREEKPVIYLSNGALKLDKIFETDSFDGFVKGLREYASWTTGVGVWKDDFEKIPTDKVYNKISPHSDVLFAERHKSKYVISDAVWSHEIESNHSKKGNYDLYKAFGIEELSITLGLYLDGDVSIDTLKYVKKCYENLLVDFYRKFSIRHAPCSYKLESFDDCADIFFNARKIKVRAWLGLVPMILRKIIRIGLRK